MDSMKITQADVFFSQALDILLDESTLKIHNVDRDDLAKVIQTLNWVKQFAGRAKQAWDTPAAPAPEPILTAAPKVKPKNGKVTK